MEDLLWNSIRLESKWNQVRKDRYYLKRYLSKNPKEMENHFKQIEAYETEVFKTPLYESDKKDFLGRVRDYKDDLSIYQNNSNHSGSLQRYSPELLFFTLFFCVGGLLALVGNQYLENSRTAQERGLREGFAEKLKEILKKHGVSYGNK